MAPVEKVFSRIKYNLERTHSFEEGKLMYCIYEALSKLNKTYYTKIFYNSFKFAYNNWKICNL